MHCFNKDFLCLSVQRNVKALLCNFLEGLGYGWLLGHPNLGVLLCTTAPCPAARTCAAPTRTTHVIFRFSNLQVLAFFPKGKTPVLKKMNSCTQGASTPCRPAKNSLRNAMPPACCAAGYCQATFCPFCVWGLQMTK